MGIPILQGYKCYKCKIPCTEHVLIDWKDGFWIGILVFRVQSFFMCTLVIANHCLHIFLRWRMTRNEHV